MTPHTNIREANRQPSPTLPNDKSTPLANTNALVLMVQSDQSSDRLKHCYGNCSHGRRGGVRFLFLFLIQRTK